MEGFLFHFSLYFVLFLIEVWIGLLPYLSSTALGSFQIGWCYFRVPDRESSSYPGGTHYPKWSDYFPISQSYPQKTLSLASEGVIFIVTADELTEWKWPMEKPERVWRDAPMSYPSPHNPEEIFQITFYICLDCWFIKAVFNRFTTQTTLQFFF